MANQNKKQLEYGHSSFSYYYIQGAPVKKQYHCFFRGARKIILKKGFYSNLGEQWQIKVKKTRVKRLDTLKLLYKCKCNIQFRSIHSEVPLKIGVPRK